MVRDINNDPMIDTYGIITTHINAVGVLAGAAVGDEIVAGAFMEWLDAYRVTRAVHEAHEPLWGYGGTDKWLTTWSQDEEALYASDNAGDYYRIPFGDAVTAPVVAATFNDEDDEDSDDENE